MKIKTQISWLIFSVLIMPVLCFIALPLYNYLSSPQHYLIKGYKQIREMNLLDIDEKDWDAMWKSIQQLPPGVQILIYYNNSVVFSTFPEIHNGEVRFPAEIFDMIKKTTTRFDYQFQALSIGKAKPTDYPTIWRGRLPYYAEKISENGILITRYNSIPWKKHRKPPRSIIVSLIFLVIFEAVALTTIILISNSISKSICILQSATEKIAGGELDTIIEAPSKRMTNELSVLTRNLEQMRTILKDDQERKNRFIMGISHDLRTPIALIKGYTEALSDGVMNGVDNIKSSLAIIHSKAEQLEDMINDMLNYVKLDSVDWSKRLEFIELKPVIDEFTATISSTAPLYKRKIEIFTSIPETTTVRMDKTLFTRAMENVFSNAIRYTRDNDSIHFSAEEKDDFIEIVMADTGIGIEPHEKEKIFDMFYRGTNSRREKGSGIGLSVVKTIIDSHGWTINVESEIGKGTSFCITIPKKA